MIGEDKDNREKLCRVLLTDAKDTQIQSDFTKSDLHKMVSLERRCGIYSSQAVCWNSPSSMH
jgi:hypothetical protein